MLKDKVKLDFCQIQLSDWVEIKSTEEFPKSTDNETFGRGTILTAKIQWKRTEKRISEDLQSLLQNHHP